MLGIVLGAANNSGEQNKAPISNECILESGGGIDKNNYFKIQVMGFGFRKIILAGGR